VNQIAPPHSFEIEKDVLSVICNRPELIYQVEDLLDDDCFYNGDNRYLFSVVMKVHFSGAAVTQSSILPQIVASGRKDILATYQQMKKYFTSDRSLVPNSEALVELSTKRALLTKSLRIIQMIEQKEAIEDIESEVTEATNIVLTRNKQTEAISMGEAVDGLYDLMHRQPVNGITGIPTGVASLDKITGGWEYDDKVIIAARPGMGKTIAATFHSFHSASIGYPTALISLEVRPAKLAGRMMSNATGFNSSDITKGRLADNQKRIITEVGDKSKSLPLYFYDNTRSRDINDICRTIRTWHRKYGIKIVYLDYIGLCRDRTIRNSSDKTAITESVQSKLTEMGDHLGIPLIIFSQLNRGSEEKSDRRPTLSNLKSSGKLEEDATRVIFLYRQDYYDSNESEARGENFIPSNDMEYIFAKNREGELGPVLLKCNVAQNRIYDNNYQSNPQSIKAVEDFYKNTALNNIPMSFGFA